MKKLRRIALAYITHQGRLLVFREPDFPEAGVQVPGGTLKENESPERGVLREAFEETGLGDLRLGAFLGEFEYEFPKWDELHRCYYYHLICEGEPPAKWLHQETDPADGPKEPITFELFWVRLPDDVPSLSGGQGRVLPKLLAALKAQ